MAMVKKPFARRQRRIWAPTEKLPRTPEHHFYERLNQVPEKAAFDGFAEGLCASINTLRLSTAGDISLAGIQTLY